MSHALVTGPGITGTVTLPDGQVIDVTDPVIYLPDLDTVNAVSDAIGARYAAEGHPLAPDFIPLEG